MAAGWQRHSWSERIELHRDGERFLHRDRDGEQLLEDFPGGGCDRDTVAGGDDHPAGATAFCDGGSVVLNANSGVGLSYQWQRDGSDIPGASGSSYTATVSGSYTVIVTANSCSKTSLAEAVTVTPLPVATITPAGATTFCDGGSVVLNANSGVGLSYQWQRDGSDIPGASGSSYTATVSGSYTVIVTANSCSKTSLAQAVTVTPLPVATITPAGATTFCEGGSVVLNANSGVGLSYQWQQDSSDIPGASGSSYTATVSGSYTVIVTANSCSKTSLAQA